MLLCLLFLFAFCSVWSASFDALTSFVRCFISSNSVNNGILLQPVMVYLSRYSYYQSSSPCTQPIHFFWILICLTLWSVMIHTKNLIVLKNSALSYILLLQCKELPNIKPAIDIFIIRTLMAYQSLPDSMAYKSDHTQIIQLCTIPFR